MIYGLRRMIYLLRKHDIISVPSYAAGIYHPFRQERISLKNDKFLSKLVVFHGGEGETYRAGYACLHGCGARNSLVSLSLGEFRPLQLFRFCRRQNVACLRRQEKRCTDFAEGECPAFVAGVRVSFRKSKTDTRMGVCFTWRRRGDSNSRAGYPTYALSRGASSPT